MDRVDRKILAVLQQEGRISTTELAERVGLTTSPCHRRLRDLEARGVITGYRCELDRDLLTLGVEILVFVEMRQEDRETLLAFERAIADLPNVIEVQRLFGNPDYVARVVVRDLTSYQELEDDHLAALPGVQRLTSTIVMKHVTGRKPLPV